MENYSQKAGFEPVFIDPTFDVGFKILMKNEIILKGLLQELIPGRKIQKLIYLDTEVVGPSTRDKRSVFDIRCEEENGRSFVCGESLIPLRCRGSTVISMFQEQTSG